MAQSNLLNIRKTSKLLDKLVVLNEKEIFLLTTKTSDCIASGCSKLEYLEAFKKDVAKTSDYLFKIQTILHSANNGIVREYDGLDKSFENVFGDTYNSISNTVSLCGIDFDLNRNTFYDKLVIKSLLFKNIFSIDSKELSKLIKALKAYEEKTDQLEKDLLFPSIEKANEIIEKITSFEVSFNNFRSRMTKEEYDEYSVTFKRSGISDVIQASSYITSEEIRQSSTSHRRSELLAISEYVKTSKYFEAVEIDPDGDILKVLRVMRQIDTNFSLNLKNKFTFKVRKLGNYKARGLCISHSRIVAVDVRETSALLHEIAHLIHLNYFKENGFVDYMICKLSSRLDFSNLPEHLEKKIPYFSDDKEVLARACEIAALISLEDEDWSLSDDDFMIIKDKSYYKELEGIYFNFSTFDGELKENMKKLFKLFYQTSPSSISNSEVDNFKKIDTNFKVVPKKKEDFLEKLLGSQSKDRAKQKALYSMVTKENIGTIVKNAKTPLDELTANIMLRYSYLGARKDRLMAKEWVEVMDDNAGVFLYLLQELENKFGKKEFVVFLSDIICESIIKKIYKFFSGEGFSFNFKNKHFKPALKETTHLSLDKFVENYLLPLKKGVMQFVNEENLRDIKFMSSLLEKDKMNMICIPADKISFDLLKYYQKLSYSIAIAKALKLSTDKVFNDFENMLSKGHKYLGFITHERLKNDKEVARWLIINAPEDILYLSNELRNDKEFMKWAIQKGAYFSCIGTKLANDKEFVIPFIKEDPSKLSYVSKELQKDNDILVAAGKVIVIKSENKSFFDKLIREGTVSDFTHTQTQEVLKVLKLKRKLSRDEFKAFNQYIKENKLGYYSRYAKGFILNKIVGDIENVA